MRCFICLLACLLAVLIFPAQMLHADELRFVYPANRTTYVAGEAIDLWLRLTGNYAGKGLLTIKTPAGTITTLEEPVTPSTSLTLPYSINSALLSPGTYGVQFTVGNSSCESVFTVVGAVPQTSFPIVVPVPPADVVQARRCRDLGANTALVSATEQINAEALAASGLRWLREMIVKPDATPLSLVTVTGGSMHAQATVQTTRSAPGFAGILFREFPPLPINDADIAAGYQRRHDAAPPPWLEGNKSPDWAQFIEFRESLWPAVLQLWARSAKEVNPQLCVVAAAQGFEQKIAEVDIELCRLQARPLGVLQPFFEAARARKAGSTPLWMAPLSADANDAGTIRKMIYASLAAGAKGIVYPPEAMQPQLIGEFAAFSRTIAAHGELLLALKPQRPRIAILDSAANRTRVMGVNPGDNREPAALHGKMACAWAACALAGSPPAIIGDDEALNLADGRYAVVIAPGLLQLARKVHDAVDDFVAAGGTFITDSDCRAEIMNAVKLPFAFPNVHTTPPTPEQIEALRQIIEKPAPPTIRCSRVDFLVSELTAGGSDRFFFVQRLSDGPELQLSAEVTFPRARATYDVFAGKPALSVDEDSDAFSRIRVALDPGQAKLFAALDAGVAGVRLSAVSAKNRTLSITVSAVDVNGRPLRAPVPAALVVRDASGAERFRVYRCIERGKLELSLPLGMNEPPGNWSAHVAELYSGQAQTLAFDMPEQFTERLITAADHVDVYDRAACVEFLRKTKSVTIVAGDPTHTKAGEGLARALQRLDIRSEIKQDKQVMREGGFELAGDAILLGTPANNLLVKNLQARSLLPISVSSRLIGRGRAIIFRTVSAFAAGGHTMTIWPSDALSLSRGIETFVMLHADQDPDSARVPKVLNLDPVPPGPPAAVELAPMISFDLADAISAVATPASGRFLLAASRSGEVCAYSATGERVWLTRGSEPVKTLLLPPAGSHPVICTDNSAHMISLVLSQKQALPLPDDGPVKAACVAPDGSMAVVATANGKVSAFDAAGKLVWQRRLDSPATLMSTAGGRTAVTEAKKLALYNEGGGALFSVELADCTSIAIAGDGKMLAAATAGGLVKSYAIPGGALKWERRAGSPVMAVFITPESRALAVTVGGDVIEPSVAKGGLKLSLGHNVHLAAEAPDRRHFVAASLGGDISIFSDTGSVRRFRVPNVAVSSICVGEACKMLVVGDWNGKVRAYRFK